jgi:hypothetical protein
MEKAAHLNARLSSLAAVMNLGKFCTLLHEMNKKKGQRNNR